MLELERSLMVLQLQGLHIDYILQQPLFLLSTIINTYIKLKENINNKASGKNVVVY